MGVRRCGEGGDDWEWRNCAATSGSERAWEGTSGHDRIGAGGGGRGRERKGRGRVRKGVGREDGRVRERKGYAREMNGRGGGRRGGQF